MEFRAVLRSPSLFTILADTLREFEGGYCHPVIARQAKALKELLYDRGDFTAPGAHLLAYSALVETVLLEVWEAVQAAAVAEAEKPPAAGAVRAHELLFLSLLEVVAMPGTGLPGACAANNYCAGKLTVEWKRLIWSASAPNPGDAYDEALLADESCAFDYPNAELDRVVGHSAITPVGYRIPFLVIFGVSIDAFKTEWQRAVQDALAGGTSMELIAAIFPTSDELQDILNAPHSEPHANCAAYSAGAA